MTIDIHTLALCLSITSFLLVLSLAVQYQINKTQKGIVWWTWGCVLYAIGFGLNYFRDSPTFGNIAIVLNNTFFTTSLAFLYAGIRSFFGKSIPAKMLISICAAVTLIAFYFTYIHDTLYVRRLVISSVVILFSYLSSKELLANRNKYKTVVIFLAAVFIINGIFFASRLLFTIFTNLDGGIFDATTIQITTYISALISSTLWTFGFILLVNHRLHLENKESTDNLELIFDTNPDAVIISRLSDGQIIKINDGFTKLLGISKDELKNINKLDSAIWKNPADQELLIEHLITKGLCNNFETELITKENYTITVLISAQTIELHGNKHLMSVIRDITDRKAVENSIQRWAGIFEHAEWGIVIGIGDSSSLDLMNPAFANMHGYTIDELTGKDISEITASEYIAILTENAQLAIDLGHHTWEARHIRKDGSSFPVLIDITVVREDDENISFRVINVQDISLQKQTENKLYEQSVILQEVNATKDKFFNIVSHDLRSPFSGILGYAELLKPEAEKCDNLKIKEYSAIISRIAVGTLQLLENLLEWSKIQRGLISPNFKKMNLFGLIWEVVEINKEIASQKNIKLNSAVKSGIYATGDEIMTKTILQNLVSNAIKFTQPNGHIKIDAVIVEKHVEIRISDNGVGIPSKILPNLFLISKNTTTLGTVGEKGSGLGLILCKELIELQGGEITVESAVNEGSTFIISLPTSST